MLAEMRSDSISFKIIACTSHFISRAFWFTMHGAVMQDFYIKPLQITDLPSRCTCDFVMWSQSPLTFALSITSAVVIMAQETEAGAAGLSVPGCAGIKGLY